MGSHKIYHKLAGLTNRDAPGLPSRRGTTLPEKQSPGLSTEPSRFNTWSGKRHSNPSPSAWHAER